MAENNSKQSENIEAQLFKMADKLRKIYEYFLGEFVRDGNKNELRTGIGGIVNDIEKNA